MNELIVFDPQNSGHHPEFLRHLIGPAVRVASDICLVRFVLHPDTPFQDEADLIKAVVKSGAVSSSLPDFVRIEKLPADLHGDGNRLPDTALAQKQIDFLIQSSSRQNVHTFFLRLNAYLRVLATFPGNTADPGKSQFTVSGILFSPSSASWRHSGSRILDRLAALREVARLRRLGRRSGLTRLFILNDPATAGLLDRCARLRGGVLPLADPIPSDSLHAPKQPSGEFGREADDSDAVRFLLIGAMRPGKGVCGALEAFKTWRPANPWGKKIHLLLAGEMLPVFRPKLEILVDEFRQSSSSIILETRFGPLSDGEWNRLITQADYLLLPYTRPLGSSGILGHAVRAGKPVLATRDGLIGSLVSEYRLGAVFRLQSRTEWHRHLDRAVAGSIRTDPASRETYLRANSVEAFQQCLTDHFLTGCSP